MTENTEPKQHRNGSRTSLLQQPSQSQDFNLAALVTGLEHCSSHHENSEEFYSSHMELKCVSFFSMSLLPHTTHTVGITWTGHPGILMAAKVYFATHSKHFYPFERKNICVRLTIGHSFVYSSL